MSEPSEQGRPTGLFGSVKALGATLVDIARDRLDLVATEFEEELTRFATVLLWAILALVCASTGFAFLAASIIIAAPPEQRALVAAIVALLFLAVAAIATWAARRVWGSKPRAFDASLTELERDRKSLGDGT